VVTKLKRGRSPYHFVEVMACPGGCTNGGGQIKGENAVVSRELLARVNGALEVGGRWVGG
jgi:iron only hydrogenase large subunit-like protein